MISATTGCSSESSTAKDASRTRPGPRYGSSRVAERVSLTGTRRCVLRSRLNGPVDFDSTARSSHSTATRRRSVACSSDSGCGRLRQTSSPRTPSSTACSTCSSSTVRTSQADRCWNGARASSEPFARAMAWSSATFRGDAQRHSPRLPLRLGGADCKARRRALRPRPLEGLVEAEVRVGAGAGDRRTPTPGGAGSSSGRCSSATTRTVGSGTPGRSAPATPSRRCASLARGCAHWRQASHRSSMPGRSRPEHTGRGLSLSHRSDLPNGRAKVGCVSRASSGCATTNERPMSFGSDRNPEPRAQRLWLTTSTLWPSGSSTKAP